MKRAFSIGISRWNSRLSNVPISAMNAATGMGKINATESSIGKLRLKMTLDIVVGTGISSTAAIAAVQMRISQCVKSVGSRRIAVTM